MTFVITLGVLVALIGGHLGLLAVIQSHDSAWKERQQ